MKRRILRCLPTPNPPPSVAIFVLPDITSQIYPLIPIFHASAGIHLPAFLIVRPAAGRTDLLVKVQCRPGKGNWGRGTVGGSAQSGSRPLGAAAASNHVLKRARRRRISAANLFYYHSKPSRPFLREDLLPNLEVAATAAHQTIVCLNLGGSDLEDALQIGAALDWKAAFIITRSVRDFKRSTIPALTPTAWIGRFESGL